MGVLLAERTLYLPSVGVAFAAVPLVALGPPRARAAWAVAGLVTGTRRRAGVDAHPGVARSTDTLLAQLAEAHPESFEGQSYLGDPAMHAGHAAEAVRHYAVAYGLVPSPFIGGSYAKALILVDNWAEAERVARASCTRDNPGACLTRIDALLGEGRSGEAWGLADSLSMHEAPSAALAARLLRSARMMGDTARIRQAETFANAVAGRR